LHFFVVLAGKQCVEIGDAVQAQDDGLAIDDKPLDAVLQRGLDNPRISLRPVLAAPGDQAHSVAVPLDPEPKAVILDFVEPFRAAWDLGAAGG
jgi:hypothetical protein